LSNNEEELFIPPDVPWKKLSSTIADLKVPKNLSPVYAIDLYF